MRALFSLIVLASFSTVSCADESCAVRATKLLSAGKISELAMWFKVPAEDAATKLKEAAEYLGPLGMVCITPAAASTDCKQSTR